MSTNPQIELGTRVVGIDHPTYFIADIAANHDGSLERAVQLIRLAAEAGADAAKFQNFRAETIVSEHGFRALGRLVGHQASWKRSVVEVYAAAELPVEWTPILHATCQDAGIDYLTAPYDLDMIDKLSPQVSAWKVGSGDITWHESIEAMARDQKPVLLATGASDMHEVRAAMEVVQRHTTDVVLMQCNTNYTGDLDNFKYVALNVLRTYASEYPWCVLGLSDHTPGHATVLGAVALGARVIEKHFTDDVGRDGPDHPFSMDPPSWRTMVDRTRELELALGPEEKRVMENERETVVVQRRAIRASRDLHVGDILSEADLVALRPCPRDAVPPYDAVTLLGRRLTRDIEAGDCVRRCDLG